VSTAPAPVVPGSLLSHLAGQEHVLAGGSTVLLARLDAHGVVHDANAACAKAGAGLWTEQVRERRLADLLTEGGRSRWAELLAAASAGSPGQDVFHLSSSNGALPCSYRVWVLPLLQGAVLFYAEPLSPLDDRQAEEYARMINEISVLARQTQKLLGESRTIAEARAELITYIAHEIRGPLGGVEFLATVIADDPQVPASARNYADIMSTASTGLLALLTTLLDHSRLDAGRLVLESRPVDMRRIIADGIGLVGGQLKGKPVGLASYIDPALPTSLLGDPTRLGQVLANLLGNAAKFIKQGEIRVTVTVEDLTRDSVRIRLDVNDSGPGIPPHIQAQLFRPYIQADPSIQRQHGGSGLGLSLCKRLAEVMGGSIGMTSQVGVGTTISMIVTLAQAEVKDDASNRLR